MVGNVMSGLLAGILLSRPVASMIADLFGWRAVFGAAAIGSAVLIGLLAWLLPERRPARGPNYVQLIASLPVLLAATPVLQRRGAYQATLFAAFSLFWTAAPLELARLGYTQRGISLFALAGAAGALAAPIAGRLADRGWGRAMTGLSLGMAASSFLVAKAGGESAIATLMAAAILLDFAVQSCLVIGQRAIYTLHAHLRSRLTGLFIAVFFLGGAAGSAFASPAFVSGGWPLVTWIGFALPLLALLGFAGEFRRPG
jgi:predicted MFS family arabinose efflux permease